VVLALVIGAPHLIRSVGGPVTHERDIDVPGHERGMAHYACLSPDRAALLIVATSATGTFAECRLVPFGGTAEQITFGPTEVGVAVALDGRPLIASIGLRQSAIWIYDPGGDRRLTSEGFVEADPSSYLFVKTDSRRNLLLKIEERSRTVWEGVPWTSSRRYLYDSRHP
jgi:hypothetical protein